MKDNIIKRVTNQSKNCYRSGVRRPGIPAHVIAKQQQRKASATE